MRNLKRRETGETERAFLAHHDALTGLPNRSLLAKTLAGAMAAAGGAGRHVAVVSIDLDDFARINATYGHAEGDRVIRACAERLTACVRSADVVSRVGGDEFVVIFGDMGSSASAARAVQRMRAALAEPIAIGTAAIELGASFGISCFPDDGGSAEQLLGFADLAMYRAKRTRPGNFAYFAPALHDAAVERVQLEHELGEAIANGELVVHYQPIIDAHTNRIGGVEALVRWAHPTEGLKAPGTFIPLAEETGLIVPLGEFVLREATRTVAQLHRRGHPGLRLAVNVSARQLHDEAFPASVLGTLAQSGLRTDRLDLEITEAFLVSDAAWAASQLRELTRLGIRIALDDFGTGCSALTYLRRFPVRLLKLDRSFVAEIERSELSRAIGAAIIGLARKLGMRTVAGGVETADAYRVLGALGCDAFQGSYFAPPMTAAALEDYLAEDHLAEAS
jgi:diguanylate cyclase (GGDEF)-like protein